MGSIEKKMKTEGLVVGPQTSLLEGMKLLKEMQDQSGARKTMNSELWHACAGPLVSLPLLGSLVYYFPQGHSEQVAVSTKRTATSQIPNYPTLPSQLLCQVHSVTMHADKDTDEIYAQMSLQPVNSENDVLPIPNFGLSPSKHPTEFFCKTLTASDTSTHGGFSVPRRAAEKLFPPLDYAMQPPTQELIVRDLHDNTWTFRHIYRGQPKRHLLTTGWSVFVGAKRLRAGDSVLFIRDDKSQLLVGVRRANRQQTTLPSSVLSADSMHIGILAAAAHAAANRSPFTIFYNPRACPSEFVIPLAKFRKAVYGTQTSIGMRFGMLFETEESGKRRYMGTIVGISDLDPLRWPRSKWRNLQVEWDEPGCGDKPSRVSPWEIETPESLFIFSSLTSGLKRPFHSTLSGAESGWGNLIRRPYLRPPENGNPGLPFSSVPYICSDKLVNVLSQPPFLNQSGILPSTSIQESVVKGEPVQEVKALQAANNHKPQVIKSENPLPQNFDIVPIGPDQSETVNSKASAVGDLPGNTMGTKLNPEASLDQSSQLTSMGDSNEVKRSVILGNPQGVVVTSQLPSIPNMIQSQLQSGFCTLQPQQTAVPQADSLCPNGLVPFVDTDDWMSYASNCPSVAGSAMSPGPLSVFGMQDQPAILPAVIPPLAATGQEIWDHHWNDARGLSQLGQLAPLPQLDPPPSLNCISNSSSFRDLSVESNDQSGIYSCLNVSNGGTSVVDPSVSNTILDELCTYKDVEVPNNSDCLLGSLSSSQDVQSQITCASLVDTKAFSVQNNPDISGGTSSSNVDFDESNLLQNSSWQQVAPPIRTYTKVQKAGSVGRSIDVRNFNNYEELLSAIECMFGLEGLLNDPRGSGWKLVYVDYENDVLLVGDDPWEEFVGCVRCIRILSPSEVQQMSEEGMKLLSGTAVEGSAAPNP